MTDKRIEKAEELAERIIRLSQNTLLLNLRYMDSAIFRLSPKPAVTTLATDGRHIFYGAKHVLVRYKTEQAQLARDLVFVFKDGTQIERIWQDKSRANSWTEEMRAQASLVARRRYAQ